MHHFHCWFRKEENLAVVTVLFMHYACVLMYIPMYKHNMYMYIHVYSLSEYTSILYMYMYYSIYTHGIVSMLP